MVDSELVEFETVPNRLLEISDQMVNGARETAPIDTPRVNVSRTATAPITQANRVIFRAVAVLMSIYLLSFPI